MLRFHWQRKLSRPNKSDFYRAMMEKKNLHWDLSYDFFSHCSLRKKCNILHDKVSWWQMMSKARQRVLFRGLNNSWINKAKTLPDVAVAAKCWRRWMTELILKKEEWSSASPSQLSIYHSYHAVYKAHAKFNTSLETYLPQIAVSPHNQQEYHSRQVSK